MEPKKKKKKKNKGRRSSNYWGREGKVVIRNVLFTYLYWMTFFFHLIGWFLSHDEQEQWLLLLFLWSYLFFLFFFNSFSLLLLFIILWTRKFGIVMWYLLEQVDWLNFIAEKVEKKGPYIALFLSFFFFFKSSNIQC